MAESRVLIEDALKYLFECGERHQSITADALSGALNLAPRRTMELLSELENAVLINFSEESYCLTSAGREYALQVVRAHRLYETYLARETGLRQHEWHRKAHIKEHEMTRDEVNKLATHLGHPRFDPHGDPIPSATGEIESLRGAPLADKPCGYKGVVCHIEDDSDEAFAVITKLGVSVGMPINIQQRKLSELFCLFEGKESKLPLWIAANITVRDIEPGEVVDFGATRLSGLLVGESATVSGISFACVGPERSRLLDLGLVSGTQIKAELESMGGSPIAYRVRGALIALRKEQSDRVLIRKE